MVSIKKSICMILTVSNMVLKYREIVQFWLQISLVLVLSLLAPASARPGGAPNPSCDAVSPETPHQLATGPVPYVLSVTDPLSSSDACICSYIPGQTYQGTYLSKDFYGNYQSASIYSRMVLILRYF